MSKKIKSKDNGNYIMLCGQNAEDVTGSCTYVSFGGKQALIECGLFQSNDYIINNRVNSEKFKFKPSEISYVFIGHVHIDHIGLLPRLVKEGFHGKIIASHETAQLMKPLLLNSAFILKNEAYILSTRYHRNYSPIYEESDVYNTLDLIYEYDESHKLYKLDDVFSFEWLDNSHCVGARQLRLTLTDGSEIKHILYTSDIGGLESKNHYVKNTEIDSRFNDCTIMECTYGEPGRVNKKTREFDLEHLKVAIDTVMERGGSVLLPCFSFSRTQEILTNLYNIYHDTDFKHNVVVDSMLSCDICNMYDVLLDEDNLKLWNKVRNWENVQFITEKDESLACVKSHVPKVVLSSSGFCTNGRILSYLHEYLSDTNSMVIFSGYTGNDNSYLAYRIKNEKDHREIKISGDPVANKADCISLGTFSSHANRNDLITFGSKQNTNKLVLVHGSVVAKNSLKDDLKKAISKEDKTYKVVASTKDMIINL